MFDDKDAQHLSKPKPDALDLVRRLALLAVAPLDPAERFAKFEELATNAIPTRDDDAVLGVLAAMKEQLNARLRASEKIVEEQNRLLNWKEKRDAQYAADEKILAPFRTALIDLYWRLPASQPGSYRELYTENESRNVPTTYPAMLRTKVTIFESLLETVCAPKSTAIRDFSGHERVLRFLAALVSSPLNAERRPIDLKDHRVWWHEEHFILDLLAKIHLSQELAEQYLGLEGIHEVVQKRCVTGRATNGGATQARRDIHYGKLLDHFYPHIWREKGLGAVGEMEKSKEREDRSPIMEAFLRDSVLPQLRTIDLAWQDLSRRFQPPPKKCFSRWNSYSKEYGEPESWATIGRSSYVLGDISMVPVHSRGDWRFGIEILLPPDCTEALGADVLGRASRHVTAWRAASETNAPIVVTLTVRGGNDDALGKSHSFTLRN